MTIGHWDANYNARGTEGVSWYQASPTISLEMIAALGLAPAAPLLDIGGGASPLASELVAAGHTDVTVLDLSEVALAEARLSATTSVAWLHADVLAWRPTREYALWHDRALFHFFAGDKRRRYLDVLRSAVPAGGFVVLGTFAPDGPAHCSGLPTNRYSPADLEAVLGERYRLRETQREIHLTPTGTAQPFTWVGFERVR